MAKVRAVKTPQNIAAIHASIHNHFNQRRDLNRRKIFKQYLATVLAERCVLMA